MRIWFEGAIVPHGAQHGTLVLGEAPAERGVGHVPLRGANGRRRLVTGPKLVVPRRWPDEVFHVANVLETVQQKRAGGGYEFDMEAAVEELDLDVLFRYERVVALGARVFAAVQRVADREGSPEGLRWLEVMQLVPDGPAVLRYPHPSGRNRWWNDPVQTERAYEVLRAFLGRARV